MTQAVMHLSRQAVERADKMRDLIATAEEEVRTGQRKRARAIKVGVALSERCNVSGIEGRLMAVSTTGAIVSVRDSATREVIDIPNADIKDWELL